MRILLSNDDGYFAPGLACLAEHLATIAEVTVVAPERDYSGASNSLTLDRPLAVKKIGERFYAINGTPTDCVHLAVTGLLDELPDMVIAGINNGANMGDDTLYSGTVAAATEGYLLGLPALAFSLCSKVGSHFETAAKVALELVQTIQERPFNAPLLLNVNVPDIPYADLQSRVVTRLGRRHPAAGTVPMTTPRGQTVYWIGAAGEALDASEGTDFYAISQQQVSMTPLRIDLTHRQQIAQIQQWLAQ